MTPDPDRIRALHDRFRLFAGYHEPTVRTELAAPVTAGPLAGRIVGLKANIACKGAVWSAGLPHRSGLLAGRDARVTMRLREAGARVLPGLNMDAAALGGTTENPHFGATLNPHAHAHSAGGSSGGAAAAVAAGLVEIAVGTDTLGSIRIPASWCGVFGLKPTFGAVGRSGIVPLAPSLDCAGPLAARAADLLPLLRVMAGQDADDPDSCPAPQGWLDDPGDLSALRIGIRSDDPVACEPEVRAAMHRAADVLRAAGATIVPVAMPDWRAAALRKAAFLLTEAEGATVHAEALEAGDALPPLVQSLLRYGRDAGTAKLVAALAQMRTATAQLARTFGEVEMLMTPTTPGRAIRLGESAPATQADYTALANVAGVPALAVPVPIAGEALPASVQFIGPAWSEARLVHFGTLLEADHSSGPETPVFAFR